MALDSIDNSTIKLASTITAARAHAPSENDKDAKKVSTPGKSSESASEVKISGGALSIKSSDNDINIEKVEQIKLAIQNGQLTMDASKIADGLIADLNSGFSA
ncbi:flagellar biosynthesis anti-sigma factor FlgM [Thorsellia anophelis]|uniref:Negative regulator of flagellin synthesis n=1 Tax=Thorsellia anophelis DSM 18579 TaxID=1123402 RepID=A0A1H9ZHY6_9GAMM|nr:flagellar biosynthesis anti-sigma factor FlgM [Thorsellia anophelis]SES80433.1 anti-sigma-28 factor, FlgM family [Thorsellia anophelis DSM 18579]